MRFGFHIAFLPYHYHLVRCLYCKRQRQTAADHSVSREGHRLRPAVSPRPAREHARSSLNLPIPVTTYFRDSHLAEPEQFLPHCSRAHTLHHTAILLTLALAQYTNTCFDYLYFYYYPFLVFYLRVHIYIVVYVPCSEITKSMSLYVRVYLAIKIVLILNRGTCSRII